MKYRVRLGASRATCALLSSILSLLALSFIAPAPHAGNPRISFGLLGEIGTFQFKSSLDGEAYALSANAKIDTAVFDYDGSMKSSGQVRTGLTAPADYRFRYRQKVVLGKKKARSLAMTFNGDGVPDVKFVPPDPPSKSAVPVTEAQLKNVLDPLSGVMALSLGDMGNPCDQRLPIFDGKQRFDLIFTPAGRAGADRLCHVRLVPISGHKPGKGSDSVISGNIEVVLRPVAQANIVVPYRVTVPTIIGAAVLTSEQVDITMPDRQRIALRR
jgi:hypothetical protein